MISIVHTPLEVYIGPVEDIDQHINCFDQDYDKGIRELAKLVSDKKVVGVGESTHGTHEFFQLKADLACELITKHGFCTFALEDNSAKCAAINNYIRTGKGYPDELIFNLYSVWRTEEVKQLILRLRKLARSYDINFIGVDIDQSILKEEPGKARFEERDRSMTDNTLKAAGNGKLFLWAHNSHVSKRHRSANNLGRNLDGVLGKEYAAIGQFFGQGTFSAKIIIPDDKENKIDYKKVPLTSVEAPPPKNGYIEDVLDKADCDTYFLNLSHEDKIEVLDRKFMCRSIGWGAVADNVGKWPDPVQPYQYYDVLVYFKNTRHSETITSG